MAQRVRGEDEGEGEGAGEDKGDKKREVEVVVSGGSGREELGSRRGRR